MVKKLIRIPQRGPILGRPGGIIGPIVNPYYEELEIINRMVKAGTQVVLVDPKTKVETELTVQNILGLEGEAVFAEPAKKEAPAPKEVKKEEPKAEVKAEVKEETKPQQKQQQQKNNKGNQKNNQVVEDAAIKK